MLLNVVIMFNTSFDISNVWNIVFITTISGLIIYIYLRGIIKKKIRLYSRDTQTEPVTIVEYDVYGEPYINGYLAVYTDMQQWNVV